MTGRYRKIQRDKPPPRSAPLMGTDRYACATHGFLADAVKGAEVWCPCGRAAKIALEGEERSTA